MISEILIGLGGNISSHIGPPKETVKRALFFLGKADIRILGQSSVYETAPVPVSGQPSFINVVLKAETTLSAQQLIDLFQRIEAGCGRKPAERWSARTLDIDLLAFGEQVLPSDSVWQKVVDDPDPAAFLPEPVVPHPRLHKRAFVLVPLLDVAPEWVHPKLGKGVAELVKLPHIKAESAGVRKISRFL